MSSKTVKSILARIEEITLSDVTATPEARIYLNYLAIGWKGCDKKNIRSYLEKLETAAWDKQKRWYPSKTRLVGFIPDGFHPIKKLTVDYSWFTIYVDNNGSDLWVLKDPRRECKA